MGSTFVGIGEKGFWIRDGILEAWLRLLALHIEDPAQENSVNAMIRDQWLLASRGFFNGCVPVALDTAVSTDEGKLIVLEAMDSLLAALEKSPETLDRGTINLLGFQGEYLKNFEVWRLLEVGQAFRDLIEGIMTTTSADHPSKTMPGCGDKGAYKTPPANS